MESENEIMVDLENQVPEDLFYVPMEPESNFDEEIARSELQRQTEELFSYIDLDPPEPDFADQIASPIAHDDCSAAQYPHVPAPVILSDSTLPSSKKTTGSSSSDTVPVEIAPQSIVCDPLSYLESSLGSKFSISTPEVPFQTHATVPIAAKHPITWNYTPPTTNPFFARALASNAKALKKPLPLVAQVPNELNAASFFAAPAASPAINVSSTANILPKPLADQQASDTPAASSNSSPGPVHSLPRDGDESVLPPLANEVAADVPKHLPRTDSRDAISATSTRSDQSSTRDSTTMKVPNSMSDIPAPAPAPAAPPSLVPVPPRVQRPIQGLSLTELINKRREEHFRLHPSGGRIDLTDDVFPSSGSNQMPSVSMPQESVQPPHITSNNASSSPALVSAKQPAPALETHTPSIQEIRDLMRQRPSSSKLSISSVASNPSASPAASATSALVPNTSPPRSITSNSTSSSNQSGSISSSSRKKRSMGMASLEMFISPISDKSQPIPTKKSTPLAMKRTSCNADVFIRRIITPTAEKSVRSPSLSPSEGRRTRRLVRQPSLQGIGAGADDVAVQPHDLSYALPEPLEDPGVTSTISPFVIPVDEEMEVQNACAHEDVPLLDDVIDDMPPSEGLQGVTESIGSLDLYEHSRSPEVDINVNQVRTSPRGINQTGRHASLGGRFAYRHYM